MTLGTLKSGYNVDMTSEEQHLLKDNHMGIAIHKSVELNKEVFTYPLLFTFDYGATAFLVCSSFRYLYSGPCWALILTIFISRMGYTSCSFLQGMAGKSASVRSMRAYFLLMTAIAFAFGFSAGAGLWETTTLPLYDYEFRLKTYKGVNPGTQTTAQYADAGAMYFNPDVTLWRGHGACLKNDHSYCVIPIVQCGPFGDCANPKSPTTGKYEYFAVGKDCCGCPNGDFRCGAWANPLATAGLRNLNDKDRLYYKLAVQQWEGTFDLKSENAIFLDWELWPAQTLYTMDQTSTSSLVLSTTGFFCVQLIVAMIADRFGII